MPPTLFITGTDTGVGKTVLTSLLARSLCAGGIRVAAFKPLCSGGRADACALHAALGGALTLDEINPWHFRAAVAPALAARLERRPIRRAPVLAHIRKLRQRFAVTLVEGAGGLLSPLGEDFDSRDLIAGLNATPVIVAPDKLGTVNHVRLTLAALPGSARRKAQVVLMSPDIADSASATNAKLLAHFFPSERILTLPWLGKKFVATKALKDPRVRRSLANLFERASRPVKSTASVR
jgi:dethiobiotin synthetase